jgi:uncharacterized cupredoxin-like copper-binding protein
LERLNVQASQISYSTPVDREAVSQELQRAGKSLQIAEEAAKRGNRTTFQFQITQAQQALNTVSQRITQIVQRQASLKPAPTNLPPQARITLRYGANTIYENQVLQVTIPPGKTAQVIFSGERSSDPEGLPLTYQWFINGQMVNTSRDFSFNLGRGTHQVLLKVRDNQGLENATGARVNVIEQEGVTIPPSQPPTTKVSSINARIDMVDVIPKSIQTGQTVTLRMRFTNIGNTLHTFIAGASLWRPDGDLNPDLHFERPVTLSPGQTTEVTWNAQVDRSGNWGYQFAVWKQKPFTSEDLLAKSPSPIAFFNVTTALAKPPAPAPPPATPLPAPQVARPEIISNLRIIEPPPYKVGQIITAEFSIRNSGNSPITFDVLTVGGRLNGQCPNNKCPDFEFRPNITLPPNGSYTYQGRLKIEAPGNYHFFTTYRTKEGQWNTAIPTLPGVRNTLDISVTPPSVTVPPPQPTQPTQPPQPYVTPSITARIDMVDITPRSVQIGQSVTLRMRFINTGNTFHTFIAGASLWRPNDYSNPVANFERSVTLSPGQSTEVTWSYQPNLTGNWGYQFAVWKQKPFVSSNLLVKQPSPIGFFSVTSPTVQAPAPTPAAKPAPTAAPAPSPQVITGRIDSYSPGDSTNPVKVKIGGSVPLTVRFTNTGNTAWRFIVGASVWDSKGNIVGNYSTTLSSPLQPGQQTSVSWNHQVRNAGDYWVQFGLWKATPFVKENLLDKKPSPAQRVISGF